MEQNAIFYGSLATQPEKGTEILLLSYNIILYLQTSREYTDKNLE